MTKKQRNRLELVMPGFANGISTQLAEKQAMHGPDARLTDKEKSAIITKAAEHYGNFLTALGVKWQDDPNSSNTPMRVAKAYVNDLWQGRYEPMSDITSFPSDGYDGIVFEGGIPLTSMCSHHHQTIMGNVHVAYIPDVDSNRTLQIKQNCRTFWKKRCNTRTTYSSNTSCNRRVDYIQ